MSLNTPIIQLQNLSFRYQHESVLENINLKIEAGQFWGLIGPNGSGKTTLLRLMLGLLPSSGEVKLFGQPLQDFRDWSKIGYVAQRADQAQLSLPITAEEAVSLGRTQVRRFPGFDNSLDQKMIESALNEVEMWPHRRELLSELSGGQLQRVLIARALAAQPQILILDEPTAGVDIQSQEKFYELLTRLNNNGLTIVIVSHDIDVVLTEVTHLACLNKTLIYEGSPKQFIKQNYLSKLYGQHRKFILHGH